MGLLDFLGGALQQGGMTYQRLQQEAMERTLRERELKRQEDALKAQQAIQQAQLMADTLKDAPGGSANIDTAQFQGLPQALQFKFKPEMTPAALPSRSLASAGGTPIPNQPAPAPTPTGRYTNIPSESSAQRTAEIRAQAQRDVAALRAQGDSVRTAIQQARQQVEAQRAKAWERIAQGNLDQRNIENMNQLNDRAAQLDLAAQRINAQLEMQQRGYDLEGYGRQYAPMDPMLAGIESLTKPPPPPGVGQPAPQVKPITAAQGNRQHVKDIPNPQDGDLGWAPDAAGKSRNLIYHNGRWEAQ